MYVKRALALSALPLAACSVGSEPLYPSLSTFAAADAVYDEAAADADTYVAQGATDYVFELPVSGSATYDGIIEGSLNGGTGPVVDHFANLTMSVDYTSLDVDGEISNVVTNLPGFDRPGGKATFTDTIANSGGDAVLNFVASGDLTQGGVTATYEVFGGGTFYGDDAGGFAGSHETDFDWTSGPDTGTTSYSDGGVVAVRR